MCGTAFTVCVTHAYYVPCEANLFTLAGFRYVHLFVLEALSQQGSTNIHGLKGLEDVVVRCAANGSGSFRCRSLV